MPRAGKYELQSEGFAAFQPSDLPPNPPLRTSGATRELLAQADRLMANLEGVLLGLPKVDPLVAMFVREEAARSCSIEGITVSLAEVLSSQDRQTAFDRTSGVPAADDYIEAMQHGIGRVASSGLSVMLLREMHALLFAADPDMKRQPGELRSNQNWVGGAGSSAFTAAYVPPPPKSVAPLMRELEDFMNEKRGLPPLIQAALVHAQLESIHPFEDGNGRIGRLLTTLFVHERGLLSQPVLLLSRYLLRRRTEYYDRLQSVRDDGDWEGWVEFFLAGIVETCREVIQACVSIVALRESSRDLIVRTFGRTTANGLVVLDELFARPFISVNRVRDLVGVTFAAANNLVEKFVLAGIDSEHTGGTRNRRFRFDAYVTLFN